MFYKKIIITVKDVKMSAELNDSNTAKKIWEVLLLKETLTHEVMRFIFPY